jgi:glycine cleavage system transcriptional repressor
VDEFSGRLLEFSCNIEESKMAVLGGEFAMIVLVSGDPESVATLVDAARAGGFVEGLEVSAKQTSPHAQPANSRPYRIECVSLDTPGIVHAVTSLLRERGINIDELETETSGAPFTGAPMFQIRITTMLAPDVHVAELRTALGEVASEHDLDIRVLPIVPMPEE